MANEFDALRVLHEQVNLAAVNHIYIFKMIMNGCKRFINFKGLLLKCKYYILTLYLLETPFNAFANKADQDQAALVRAA